MVASVSESEMNASADDAADPARLRACVRAHLRAVWRMLRRHGVSEADADDATQKVFLVLARKLAVVERGRELSYLMRTAVLVASETRRTLRRRHESDEPPPDLAAPLTTAPDAALEQRQALAQLDAILDRLDASLRTVFVMHEIEELTMAEIADVLQVPAGTVASRLRRAREAFESMCSEQRGES
jgi:RNA polymerase sigma-70 factor (ECF subfamily)